jgi:hypothetical protein
MLFAALLLVGCGARPVAPTARLDVLHDVFVRGAPAPAGAAERVALTFTGPDACTADLLARLRAPAPNAKPVVATFFLERSALEKAAKTDPEGLKIVVGRLATEGHAIGLGVPVIESAWAKDPAAFRAGLAEEAAAVEALLRAHGLPLEQPIRLWRPTGPQVDLTVLGLAAAADRPVVLWTLHGGGVPHEQLVAELAGRVGDGDIIALPTSAGCGLVDELPGLAEHLRATGLEAVTVPVILGRTLNRHRPAKVARYHGLGLPEACVEPLGLAASSATETAATRWGLVVSEAPEVVRVLPIPAADTAQALVTEVLPAARRLWATGDWSARPGCARRVDRARLLAPVSAHGAQGVNRLPTRKTGWWVVADVGIERRDPRALAGPERPVTLPAPPDLVRLEARQRFPWRLRGLLAAALQSLQLEVPLLVESRSSVAVVVGASLEADEDGVPPRASVLRAAIAGYVQVAEVTLGEYLFLARRYPADLPRLQRAARAADGFLRAGPFVVSAIAQGGAPDPARLGPDGQAAFSQEPATLLAAVLRAGHQLHPGDIIAVAAPPVAGPPSLPPSEAGPSLRATLRRDLARSMAAGFDRGTYLRPGSVRRVYTDHLGALAFRMVVPPGVSAPIGDGQPLVGPREGAQ